MRAATPNDGYSKALPLLLLETWNRQHGTVLHSDQRICLENGEPTTSNYFFQLTTCNSEHATAPLTHPKGRKETLSFLPLSSEATVQAV